MSDYKIPVSKIRRRWLRRIAIIGVLPLLMLATLALTAVGIVRHLIGAVLTLARSGREQWK